MATKKSNTAVATSKAKVPVSADVMAAIRASVMAQAEMVSQSSTNRIKLNSATGKRFVFPDKSELESFDGIVVDFSTVQILRERPDFVAGAENNVVCYASATKPTDLAPNEGVLTPQATDCATCPKSKFTKDAAGKSVKPECGMRKLLAILPTDATNASELLVLDLPVMSAKEWDKYAQSVLSSEGVPVWGAVTKFSFDNTVKFDSPRFTFESLCDGNQAEVAFARINSARSMVLATPTINVIEEVKPVAKGRRAA